MNTALKELEEIYWNLLDKDKVDQLRTFLKCQLEKLQKYQIKPEEIPIYPDIRYIDTPIQVVNQYETGYTDVKELKVTLLKLNFEEFIIPLRESLKLHNTKQNDPRGMFFYINVYSIPTIVSNIREFKSIMTLLHFDLEKSPDININWNETKRLFPGNILILSLDKDFRTFDAICKIAFKKTKVNIDLANNIRLNFLNNRYVPVEIVSGYIIPYK